MPHLLLGNEVTVIIWGDHGFPRRRSRQLIKTDKDTWVGSRVT